MVIWVLAQITLKITTLLVVILLVHNGATILGQASNAATISWVITWGGALHHLEKGTTSG